MSKKHKGQCIRIDNKEYPVVCEFPILRIGWEMDNKGYLVQDGDKTRFASTNHGRFCWMSISEVSEYIGDLYSALKQVEAAYNLHCKTPGAEK